KSRRNSPSCPSSAPSTAPSKAGPVAASNSPVTNRVRLDPYRYRWVTSRSATAGLQCLSGADMGSPRAPCAQSTRRWEAAILFDVNASEHRQRLDRRQAPDRVFSRVPGGGTSVGVRETIRVALVNDYEIVLEGLRALLRPYDPEIRVVELDVEANPQGAVDVTFFDTYGEVQERRERVRRLAADARNGAI